MVLDVRAIQQTVQDFQPKAALGASMFIGVTQREFYLPAVGTRERDRQLRTWDRSDYNAKWRGARSGILKKEAGLSWNITGKAMVQVWSDHDGWDSVDAVTHFQDVLQNAHFGAGWQYFVKRLMRDYYAQDFGAVVEIIGPGEPDEPLAGAVTGIAVLDSLRCFATGNPVYPILYFSHLTNRMHRMHHTRVARFVDVPDGDERMYGAGECALSRYISTAYREMLMTRYIEGRLDDKPQPGMNVVSNISEGQVQTAFAAYDRQQMSDERPVWGKTVWFYSLDPSAPAKVEPISFAQTPEKFDYQVYTNQDVNELALAFNTDKNDIWELTGGNIGSGQQSEVQAQKARGKVVADFIALIERLVNMHLLPDGVDFAIKNRDEAEEKAQSELDKTLMDIAGSMKALGIPAININQMLVNRSETFRDVLTDDNGKIIATAQVDYVKPAVIDATVTNSETNAPDPATQPAVKAAGEPDPDRADRFSIEEYEIISPDSQKDFDPSQARADDGKWSETGAGGIGGAGKKPPKGKPKKPEDDKPSQSAGGNYRDFGAYPETMVADSFQRSAPLPSAKQANALETYRSMDGNLAINRPLRTSGKLDAATKMHVKQLDDVLATSKLEHDAMLYRGIPGNSNRMQQFTSDLQSGKIKPGAILKDNGFSSTTLDGSIASTKFGDTGGVVFNIKAPKGSNGLYVNSAMDKYAGGRHDHEYRDEKEVLLPRGSKFRIEAVKKTKTGYVVDATLDGYEASAIKDYSSTRSEFTNLFTELSHGGLNDDVSRRRFGTVMRAQLRRLGQQAYQDGMKAGGVDDALDDDDLVRVQDWLGQQSEYVTSFADSLFKGKISADEVGTRAELWINKSLDSVYQEGVRSADANGLYTWQLGPTEKHCLTCSRLAGQTHRMKEWYRRDLLPRSDKLACNGFRCACQLQRTAGKAQGRF